MVRDMVMVYLNFLMEILTLEYGRMGRLVEREFIFIRMGRDMKGNQLMELKKVLENINIIMEIDMKDFGRMIRKMEKVFISMSCLVRNIQAIGRWEKKKAGEYLNFLQEINIEDNLKTTKNMEKGKQFILVVLHLLENGIVIWLRVKEKFNIMINLSIRAILIKV